MRATIIAPVVFLAFAPAVGHAQTAATTSSAPASGPADTRMSVPGASASAPTGYTATGSQDSATAPTAGAVAGATATPPPPETSGPAGATATQPPPQTSAPIGAGGLATAPSPAIGRAKRPATPQPPGPPQNPPSSSALTFDSIAFDIRTGADDLRGDSRAWARFGRDLGAPTCTLKERGQDSWYNGSVHRAVCPLSAAKSLQDLRKLEIALVMDAKKGLTGDNWDILWVTASAYNRASADPPVCVRSAKGPTPTTRVFRFKSAETPVMNFSDYPNDCPS